MTSAFCLGREHLPASGTKGDLLIEKLHDLSSSGAKVLVFSQFTTFLSLLKKRIRLELPDLETLELTGSTRDRSKPVDRFESSTNSVVMLASLKAAGLGVTLKSADYVFLMDPWWNPAVEEQAIDRAHRLGRENQPLFIVWSPREQSRNGSGNYNCRKKKLFARLLENLKSQVVWPIISPHLKN